VSRIRHELFVHVLFSTKGRRPTIPNDMKERLWTHMQSICKEDKIGVHAIGGTTNHVHLLLEPPPTISMEEMVLKIQAASAEWMNRQVDNFAWQEWRMQHQQSPCRKCGEVHPTSGSIPCNDNL
jgi:putative transposase